MQGCVPSQVFGLQTSIISAGAGPPAAHPNGALAAEISAGAHQLLIESYIMHRPAMRDLCNAVWHFYRTLHFALAKFIDLFPPGTQRYRNVQFLNIIYLARSLWIHLRCIILAHSQHMVPFVCKKFPRVSGSRIFSFSERAQKCFASSDLSVGGGAGDILVS